MEQKATGQSISLRGSKVIGHMSTQEQVYATHILDSLKPIMDDCSLRLWRSCSLSY